MKKKPNFFIVGAPKAGSTSLYYYLEQHPEIYMSPIKETNFFSREEINASNLFYKRKNEWTIEEYENQFKGVTLEKAIGEASVSYLFYPGVPQKIKAYNPNSKIIILLRNPFDRGFSHYLMDKRVGFTNLEFEDIVYKREVDAKMDFFYQQYIELGLYYNQVKRYFETFGSDNVKVLYFEDMVKDAKKMVKKVFQFLEVNEEFIPETEKKHNEFRAAKNPLLAKLYAQKKLRKRAKELVGTKVEDLIKQIFFSGDNKPVLPSHLKDELTQIYRPDILKTGELLGKDLNHWLI